MDAKAWIKGSCLASALAAHAMLRRRGIASSLCLGVARDEGAMAAHAWIEVGQDVIVGAAEAVRFTRIAQFGAAAARSEACIAVLRGFASARTVLPP